MLILVVIDLNYLFIFMIIQLLLYQLQLLNWSFTFSYFLPFLYFPFHLINSHDFLINKHFTIYIALMPHSYASQATFHQASRIHQSVIVQLHILPYKHRPNQKEQILAQRRDPEQRYKSQIPKTRYEKNTMYLKMPTPLFSISFHSLFLTNNAQKLYPLFMTTQYSMIGICYYSLR